MKLKKNLIINIDEYCYLRTLTKSDVNDRYLNWLNDYEIFKYTEQKYFKHSIESTVDFVVQKYKSEVDLLLGIFCENIHIGNIKLGPIRWEHKSSEISYFIGDKSYWQKGIATKCVKALLKYANEELFLEKINAGYYKINLGSAKVLKNCGFVIEGERLNDVIFEGQRISSILVGYIFNNK